MNSFAIAGASIFVVGVLAFWLGFRIAFPKTSSGSVRAIALVMTLFLWSATIRRASLTFFNSAEYLISLVSRDQKLDIKQILVIFNSIPYFDLLIWFVALCALVRLLSALQDGTSPQWLQNFLKTSTTFRLNLLVLLIFFLGVYLAIACLCTIPSLQVNQPFTDEEKTQITAQIDAADPSSDAFNRLFPQTVSLPSDELIHLRSIYAEAAHESIAPQCSANAATAAAANSPSSQESRPPLATAAPPQPKVNSATPTPSEVKVLEGNPNLKAAVRELIQAYDAARCARLAQYQSMRSEVENVLQSEANNAKNMINSNLAMRLTGRDRADYLYDQRNRLQNNSNGLQGMLSRCAASLADPDYAFTNARSEYEQILNAPPGATPASTPVSYQYLSGASTLGPCVTYSGFLQQSGDDQRAPRPSLGLFSFWFGWLEDSDSLALSVLCGMLGVGLVGSVVSSFIRQSQPGLTEQAVRIQQKNAKPGAAGAEQHPTELQAAATAPPQIEKTTVVRQWQRGLNVPWVADPFPVIVRGFTAAIVVYLAIEGGLNIFSAASNQPNPYVLLFACLVGAVFSEDVWVMARNKLPSAEGAVTTHGPVTEVKSTTEIKPGDSSKGSSHPPTSTGGAPRNGV